MAARFTYSRWDGTQRGFDLDADGLFDELTDDLLYHGDVNSALRRMMQDGMRDRNGERLQGLRELMEKLRQQRQDRLDQFDLGGVQRDLRRVERHRRRERTRRQRTKQPSAVVTNAAPNGARQRCRSKLPLDMCPTISRQGTRATGLRLRVR